MVTLKFFSMSFKFESWVPNISGIYGVDSRVISKLSFSLKAGQSQYFIKKRKLWKICLMNTLKV